MGLFPMACPPTLGLSEEQTPWPWLPRAFHLVADDNDADSIVSRCLSSAVRSRRVQMNRYVEDAVEWSFVLTVRGHGRGWMEAEAPALWHLTAKAILPTTTFTVAWV